MKILPYITSIIAAAILIYDEEWIVLIVFIVIASFLIGYGRYLEKAFFVNEE